MIHMCMGEGRTGGVVVGRDEGCIRKKMKLGIDFLLEQ